MPIFKKPKEGAALQEMHEVKTINRLFDTVSARLTIVNATNFSLA